MTTPTQPAPPPVHPLRGWVRHRLPGFTLETSWDAAPGTVTVLFGPSGAGKSMTLRAIAGLVRPREGRIEVGGATVMDGADGTWVPPHRRRVGYMPQDYGLFPHLTVAENVRFGMRGLDGPRRRAKASALIASLGLAGLEERHPWQLSGGQRQRVALARALATDPAALLLDEPFAALDQELRREVRREVRDVLRASRMPVLLVTHDAEEALALADSVTLIDDGRIILSGDPVTVLRQPPQPRVARLAGVENLLTLTVETVRPRDDVMVCRHTASGTLLETPLAEADAGDAITIGVRAADVILATEAPRGLSARNVLPARVVGVEPASPGYDVRLDCGGMPLVCHVTGHTLNELGIAEGGAVWAVVKASSCFVLHDDAR